MLVCVFRRCPLCEWMMREQVPPWPSGRLAAIAESVFRLDYLKFGKGGFSDGDTKNY